MLRVAGAANALPKIEAAAHQIENAAAQRSDGRAWSLGFADGTTGLNTAVLD
jgi:hypothetical protein